MSSTDRAPLTVSLAKQEGYSPLASHKEVLPLPTNRQRVAACFEALRIDDPAGYIIPSHDSPVWGIHRFIGTTANLDHLNYIALLLGTLSRNDEQKLNAILSCPQYIGPNTGQLIHLLLYLDAFTYLPEVTNFKELSLHTLCDEKRFLPYDMASLFDYEKHWQTILYMALGRFSPRGYIAANHDTLRKITAAMEVPEAYRIVT